MPKAQPLLLDLYPNAAVAYSLRKLRDAYTGPAIRVRRAIDNAEQDFGFNDFNNTLIDFVGYNLWTFSEEWDNAVWTKTGLNTTGIPPYVNVAVAPDGTTTADKITETIISQSHLTSRQLLVTNGVTYNVSVYLKYGGRNARVVSTLDIANTYTVDVNLLTGTLSNNTFPITPILEDVGSGWYRLSYQVTATFTQTRTVITINLLNPTGLPTPINYPGDGVSGVFIWGAQATATSLVRKYTKTVATANVGNGFVSIWYDQSGNGNNATQSSPSSQAQIVINGNIIIDTTTLKPTTTWTADSYGLINGVNPNTRYLSVSVNTRLTINDQILHLGTTNNPGTVNGQQSLRWRGSDGLIQSFRHTQSSHGLITTNGSYIIMSEKDSNNLKSVSINGFVNSSGTEVPANGTFMNQFGRSSAVAATTAQYQEFIYWDSEQSANRANIETLINDYYGIF
jgi:hypothetical protein